MPERRRSAAENEKSPAPFGAGLEAVERNLPCGKAALRLRACWPWETARQPAGSAWSVPPAQPGQQAPPSLPVWQQAFWQQAFSLLSSQRAFSLPFWPRAFSWQRASWLRPSWPWSSSLPPSSPAPSWLRPSSPEPSWQPSSWLPGASLRPSSPEPSSLLPSSPGPSSPRSSWRRDASSLAAFLAAGFFAVAISISCSS